MALPNGANDRLKNEGNILDRLDALEAKIAALGRRDVSAASLGEITDNLGEVRAGRFLALSSGAEPTDADGCGVAIDAEGTDFGDGVLYHIVGVNNGALMFGLRATDGAGVFAGGAGLIDANGINLNGIRYALRHYAAGVDGTSDPRYGAFEMYYPDAGTIPALRVSFYDAVPGTSLVANGDFETGDLTGWTGTATAPDSVFVDNYPPYYVYGGTYSAHLLQTFSSATTRTASLTSDAITVSPLNRYSFSAQIRIGQIAPLGQWSLTYTVKVQVNWYNAGATLISSTTLYSRTGSFSTQGFIPVASTINSPTGAVTAKIYIEAVTTAVSTGGGGTRKLEIDIDDVSLTEAALFSALQFGESGMDYSDGMWPKTQGWFFDQAIGPALTEGGSTSQRYLVQWYDNAGTDGAEWSFGGCLAAGTYTLDMLGVKANDRGKIDFYVDGVKVSTTPFDWYAASAAYNVHQTVTGVVISNNGYHVFKIKINGRNASNTTGYNMMGTRFVVLPAAY